MEVLYAHHRLPRGLRPPMTSSPMADARCQYLLDLLAQVPDPRKRRGRRHPLAGLLATGIAAVVAGSRSFAAIGQWAVNVATIRKRHGIPACQDRDDPDPDGEVMSVHQAAA